MGLVTKTPEDLADKIVALEAVLVAERERAARVAAELAVAKARASEDAALIAHQRLQIAKLTRQLYGPRAERTARLLDQLELTFEELESAASEDEIAAERAVAKTTNVVAFTRKRPARQPFPAHLPRERVVEPAPTVCQCCGGTRLRKLGEDITETLEVIPRQWKVLQHVREKFTCRDCERISQAPAPFHVVARGWAGPSLLAMILFEKFGQHQPLNRQAERYAREGVPLSLSTLADQSLPRRKPGSGPAARCWRRSCAGSRGMSSRPNGCTATTQPCRSWPRARPADYGPMCATTDPLAGGTPHGSSPWAEGPRRRCSITRAIAAASIRRRTLPRGPGSSRPTPSAGTPSGTKQTASRARLSRRDAGHPRADPSLSWPMSRRRRGAVRRATPRQ